MKYEDIIRSLNHQSVEQRLGSVRVLGLVEETEALAPLRSRFKSETDEQVKAAMDWAGKRIFTAQQRGYTTLQAIFQEFRINQEVERAEDPREAELEKQMEARFVMDMAKSQERAATEGKMTNMAVGLLLGGATGAVMGAMGPGLSMGGADLASSNLGSSRPEVGKQRIPAQIPTDIPIEMWVKRLRGAQTGADRKKAVMQFLEFNNPAALPHMVEVYLNEQVVDVRDYIEKSARTIYLKMRYWEYSQNGTIDAMVEQMINARFKK